MRKSTFLTTALICFQLFVTVCHGQQVDHTLIPISNSGNDSGQAQSILERMKAYGIVGVSIAIFDNGKIIQANGYGLRDKELGLPADTGTLFQAASVSKPFASAAALRLVEQNRLALDEDVNIKLASWKVPENKFTVSEKVTVRRIISHMSGLGIHGFEGYNPAAQLPTIPQILDGVAPCNGNPVRVIAVPGKEEIYSGGGFTVLQLLMTETCGKPFNQIMQELILQPVWMSQSSFDLQLSESSKMIASKGYRKNGEMVDGGYHVYPESAAAGLWTTAQDLARFMLDLGASYRENKGVLQQATVQQMLTRVPGGGGLGIGIDGQGESFRFRHNGGNAGFSSYAVSFADNGRGMVVLTNGDNADRFIHELVRAVAREHHWPAMWPRD